MLILCKKIGGLENILISLYVLKKKLKYTKESNNIARRLFRCIFFIFVSHVYLLNIKNNLKQFKSFFRQLTESLRVLDMDWNHAENPMTVCTLSMLTVEAWLYQPYEPRPPLPWKVGCIIYCHKNCYYPLFKDEVSDT